MGKLYSFPNEAREIYSNARRETRLLVKAGKVKPDGVEKAFRELASKRLSKIGLKPPKDWK